MKRNRQHTGSGNAQDSPCDSETIVLDEDLELAGAGVLLEKLRMKVAKKCSMVMDGSQVRVVDTAVLQLLVAVFRHAQQQQTQISWQQPSDVLRDSAALLGLGTLLCLASSAT
jgi:anti-anti-sigma regulatory factor